MGRGTIVIPQSTLNTVLLHWLFANGFRIQGLRFRIEGLGFRVVEMCSQSPEHGSQAHDIEALNGSLQGGSSGIIQRVIYRALENRKENNMYNETEAGVIWRLTKDNC